MSTFDKDPPHRPPANAADERRRLIDDAIREGADVGEALDLADRLARLSSESEAYRAVDRRLMTGYTVQEAEDILLNDADDSRKRDEA